MRNEVKLITSAIAYVKLTPENANDRKLLEENVEKDTIEWYYITAVRSKLPDYELLQITDQSEWPYAAQAKVQKVVGIG